MSCSGCARRRKKIGEVVARVSWRRIITMPWHMNPGWLPSQERDNWIAHRDRALTLMGYKGKAGLRKYQRGNFAMFPAGSTAIAAAGDCSFTASAIPNLSDFVIEPDDSRCRAKLDNNGDWYWSEGTTSWGASRGTWIGDCANTEYDGQWNDVGPGDPPNEVLSPGSSGVWQAMSTDCSVGLVENGFGVATALVNIKLRDGTSLNELFTDSFELDVEVEARN